MSFKSNRHSQLTNSEKLLCNEISLRPHLYNENDDFYVSSSSERLQIFKKIAEKINSNHPAENWDGEQI